MQLNELVISTRTQMSTGHVDIERLQYANFEVHIRNEMTKDGL